MNITDCDDKILARAKERNVSPYELAQTFEQEFWEDMDALNVMRPTVVTRVTEHVESSIIPYIQQIEENGMAYVMEGDGDGDGAGAGGGVYFDVRAFEAAKGDLNRYGKLASLKGEEEEHENGAFFAWDNSDADADSDSNSNKNQPRKKDPRDFVLWKRRDHNNDSDSDSDSDKDEEMIWDSPWGKGRPGWHIECSAMIESTMQSFDQYKMHVHAGGIDLKFPHHTNEIAQAEAYRHTDGDGDGDDEEWIPHWVHTGHLHIDGLKMSKSLKNFVTIRQMLGLNDNANNAYKEQALNNSFHSAADDFRLWCLGLSGSYRGPATYSKTRLHEAKVIREKITHFLIDGEQWLKQSKSSKNIYSAKWSKGDHDLVSTTSDYQASYHRALLGLSTSSAKGCALGHGRNSNDGFDFDGSAYLRAAIEISEAGKRYISESHAGDHPIYPVHYALGALRECLSLVGFKDETVMAGLSQNLDDTIPGGKEALVEELVGFRSAVREMAIESMKRKGYSFDNADADKTLPKALLKMCDDLRDSNLPDLGLEVFDGDNSQTWRFGPVKERKENPKSDVLLDESNCKQSKSERGIRIQQGEDIMDRPDVSESNFFQVGRYEGLFSEFDSNSVPSHNADGSELSKRKIKKLIKKRESFFRNKSR